MSEYKIDYDEISPIGGNKSVFVEWDEGLQDNFKLCMETGYHTYYKSWRVSNKELIQSLEKSMADTVKNSKVTIATSDGDKVLWYPFTSFNTNAALYPELDKFNQLKWKICKLKRVKNVDEVGNTVYKYPDFVNDKPVLILYVPESDTPDYEFGANEFETAFELFQTEYKVDVDE